jgi:hypothetical protein
LSQHQCDDTEAEQRKASVVKVVMTGCAVGPDWQLHH